MSTVPIYIAADKLPVCMNIRQWVGYSVVAGVILKDPTTGLPVDLTGKVATGQVRTHEGILVRDLVVVAHTDPGCEGLVQIEIGEADNDTIESGQYVVTLKDGGPLGKGPVITGSWDMIRAVDQTP